MALTKKQNEFLKALLTNKTIKDAYLEAGVSEGSAYKYLKDEKFIAELNKYKRETLKHISTRLNNEALKAIDVLTEVAHDPTATPASRVSGAKTILEYAYKSAELEDIEQRIEALEKLFEEE